MIVGRALTVVALLGAVGCKRTNLSVTGAGPGVARDLRRLCALVECPASEVRTQGDTIVMRFQDDVSDATKAQLHHALDRAQHLGRAQGGTPLVLRITEKDPRLLAAMGLATKTSRDFPVQPRIEDGKRVLKTLRGQGDGLLGQGIFCGYEMPLEKPLPGLEYRLDVDARKLKGKSRALAQLAETMSEVPIEAGHEFVAQDPELQALMEKVSFPDQSTMNIQFAADENETTTVLGASSAQFLECAAKVLRGNDAFFRELLFPGLSGNVKDHKLEDTLF